MSDEVGNTEDVLEHEEMWCYEQHLVNKIPIPEIVQLFPTYFHGKTLSSNQIRYRIKKEKARQRERLNELVEDGIASSLPALQWAARQQHAIARDAIARKDRLRDIELAEGPDFNAKQDLVSSAMDAAGREVKRYVDIERTVVEFLGTSAPIQHKLTATVTHEKGNSFQDEQAALGELLTETLSRIKETQALSATREPDYALPVLDAEEVPLARDEDRA